jgi:hypothetical protein
MNARSPIASQASSFLGSIADLGLCKDGAFAARLAELGEPVDRSSIVRWRSGARTAPLGILPILLNFVDDPAAVLDLLAAPVGLRCVPDAEMETDDRGLLDRALELATLTGAATNAIREALADGETSDAEREQVRVAAERLERAAAELKALARPVRRVS